MWLLRDDDEGRTTNDEGSYPFRRWSFVFRRSTKTRPLVQGRGARSRCHPGLPKPHGPGLNGLRRPSLVTGGAGLGLPPTRRANASMRSHRLGSAPQLRSVLPRGRRRHCSDCRSLGCAVSLVLSPSTLLADVRMWRGGYHGPCDVSRRILADSNDTGPQSDTPWMPNYGPGPLPILTLDSARYLTRLSTFPATCLGRASLGTPVVPIRPRADFRFDA